ncbi:MAG: hypothetical protein MUC64_13575, partial [Rubritepida sp.]|nr:hypothetical protein [Rubritepida sp.]
MTGHRTLPEATLPALRRAVAEVLARVRTTVQDAAAQPEVAAVYDLAAAGPILRLLSPLADGADRLVAEEALALGYRLDVVLPFAQADYERMLDEPNASAFRALLARADAPDGTPRVVTLDGAPDELRGDSYRAVGHFLVRNCDLLIAVWDGRRAAGRGGTAEVVRAALAAGLPVWWIDPARPEAARLLHPADPTEALTAVIRRAIEPLVAGRRPPHGALEALALGLNRALRLTRPPTQDYLREAPPPPPWLRGLYAGLLDRIAPRPAGEPRALLPPSGPTETWWERHHATAARLAGVYADRYRSSYVMVFLLAGITVLAAAFALAVPHSAHLPFLMIELS